MIHTPPKWDSRYPDRDRLRLETECLAECFRDQLLAQIPEGEIRAIYLKGSVVKPWESPLDYAIQAAAQVLEDSAAIGRRRLAANPDESAAK